MTSSVPAPGPASPGRRHGRAPGRHRIVIATSNRGKTAEIRRILSDLPVDWMTLAEFPGAPGVTESGTTFEGNAQLKAEAYARFTGEWALADDSGLEVDALGGRPGIESARFAGAEQDPQKNIDRLLAELERVPDSRRTARFVCAAVVSDGRRVVAQSRGACEGVILRARRGAGGFGYDPVFLVPAAGKTFAELGAEEKDRISHRARALEGLRAALLPTRNE